MNNIMVEIKSDTKLINPIIAGLFSIGRINNFGKELMWALEISLREILANSIIHGNKEDKRKKVSIELEWDKKIFRMSIKDEGKGFPYKKKKPKITKEGEFPELSGRGWIIVEDKMDILHFEKRGKGFMVIAEKKIN